MLSRLATAALLFTAVAHAQLNDLQCTQTGPTEYRISYTQSPDTHAVQILASTSADGSSGMQPLLTTSNSVVTVHAGEPGQRIYFFLKPDHGVEREVSIRHLPLQGTPNFRDLGGYETTDGHFVKWGLLYRSGVLTHLTLSDFAYLKQLGIRVVCDFRTSDENAVDPEIWVPGVSVDHLSLPIGGGDKKGAVNSLNQVMATHPSADQLRQMMLKIYGAFAFTNAPEYAKLFKEIEHDHLPLLYHCSAGKDRTGVFSAFVLLILGVPEKTVLADYALTNRYLLHGLSAADTKKMLSADPGMEQLTPEQRKVLMAADPAYLESTLRRIDEKYGSFDAYRREALGVSDQEVAWLRSRLLQR